MGHRALVAYERSDGRYDLHRAHWGGDRDLRAALTREAPFGGPRERTGLAALLDRLGVAPAGGVLASDPGWAVDPEPVATGLGRREVHQRVDFGEHELLYVVSAAFDVTAYAALGFGLDPLVRPAGGALVELPDDDFAVDRRRAWWRGVRDGVRAARPRGTSDGDCRPLLVAALRERAGDRAVVVVDEGDRD